jgi:hypothetical protein
MKLRRLTRMIGWSALVVMPVSIGVGYFQAMWPYSRGFPPTLGPPRWDHMALIVAGGAALSVVVGAQLFGALNLMASQTTSSEKDTQLPEVGQRWEERDTPGPASQGIRPAASNIRELPRDSQDD